jgi:hypothetical protein
MTATVSIQDLCKLPMSGGKREGKSLKLTNQAKRPFQAFTIKKVIACIGLQDNG